MDDRMKSQIVELPAWLDPRACAHKQPVVSSRIYENKATARQISHRGYENLQLHRNEVGDDSNNDQIEIYKSGVSKNTHLKIWCRGWITPLNIEWCCIDLGEDNANFEKQKLLQNQIQECDFEEGHDTSYMQNIGLEIKSLVSDPRLTDDGPCVAIGSRIYCVGGLKFPEQLVLEELYVLDTSIKPLRWETATKMHMPRFAPITAVLDGKIFIIGTELRRREVKEFTEFQGYCEIFDTHANKTKPMACLPHHFRNTFEHINLIGVIHESKEILLFSIYREKILRYHVNEDNWTCGEAPDDLFDTGFFNFGYVLAGSTLYWLNPKVEACAYNLSDCELYKSKGPLDFLKNVFPNILWSCAKLSHLTRDEFCLVFYDHVPGYTLLYCMKLQISLCIDKDSKFLSVSLKSTVNYHATFKLHVRDILLVTSVINSAIEVFAL